MSLSILPLSQRDPRWAKKLLGFSKNTIHSYGCTLTCFSMLLGYIYGFTNEPDLINTRLKSSGNYHPINNKHGAFLNAYLVWANIPRLFSKIKFVKRGWNYNNTEVSYYIYIKKLPVLVEVNAAKIGAAKHWVLAIGGGKIVDPWDGKVKSIYTYPLTGYALFDRS